MVVVLKRSRQSCQTTRRYNSTSSSCSFVDTESMLRSCICTETRSFSSGQWLRALQRTTVPPCAGCSRPDVLVVSGARAPERLSQLRPQTRAAALERLFPRAAVIAVGAISTQVTHRPLEAADAQSHRHCRHCRLRSRIRPSSSPARAPVAARRVARSCASMPSRRRLRWS